jgi:hypothetical protein
MHNVQLSEKERTVVFVELDSRRILGFGPELAKPSFPKGVKYTETVLLSAREIENWVGRYREQQIRDAEETTYRQLEREAPIRAAIRKSLLARNASSDVNNYDRALNNVYVRLMDEKYDAMMKAKAKPEVFGMAEAYEEGVDSERIAMDSPYMRGGE